MKVVESGFWFCTVVGTYVMNVSLKKEMVRREPVLVGVLVFVKKKDIIMIDKRDSLGVRES